jgi:hypothetical protein
MTEHDRKMEAVGDGLLLACARLYIFRQKVEYNLYAGLTQRLVSNETIAIFAHREGLAPVENATKPYARALEIEIARRYYEEGFRNTRHWLFGLFDKHVNIRREIETLKKNAA